MKIKNIDNFEAIGTTVLVKIVKEEKKDSSGLVMPDTVKETEPADYGYVVSVPKYKSSNGVAIPLEDHSEYMKKLVAMGLKKDDIVALKKFDYTKVFVEGSTEEYRIYNVDSIVGVIRGGKNE